MVRISVFYRGGEGKRFDRDYYITRHMALVRERMGAAGLRRIEVDRGLASGGPGAPPPFVGVGHLYFDTLEAFQRAIAPCGKELFADVPNFTDITPEVQISEITEVAVAGVAG